VLNLRSAVIGMRPKINLLSIAPARDATIANAARGRRKIWIGDWHDAAVFDRLALPTGAVIEGPAVLEQPDATTLIEPGSHASVDRYGNLILERSA